ncbi:MAG: tetratricopeptide repeat-containing protein [Anaerolineae bacterium]|nr:MAG: tetratricopeptide repeat-containing protein [Anaerolineae bacterium]
MMHNAIEFYEQRLAQAEASGDQHGIANTLDSLGNAHRNLGDVRRAIELHQQALALFRQIGDRLGKPTRWATWASPITGWSSFKR